MSAFRTQGAQGCHVVVAQQAALAFLRSTKRDVSVVATRPFPRQAPPGGAGLLEAVGMPAPILFRRYGPVRGCMEEVRTS